MDSKVGLLFIVFWLKIVIVSAQTDRVMTIPAAIYIENAYTFEPQEGVEIQLNVKQPNGTVYWAGTYRSNVEGMIPLSLLPNTVYQISSRKATYYSQLTLLETRELSRTGNNRFNISLRPKSCYRLQGQLAQTVGEGSYFELTEANTGSTQRVRIRPDGRYYACGQCGDTYYLTAQLNGEAQMPDTVYLNPSACASQRSPIMNLSFEPRPAPVEEIVVQEDTTIAESAYIPVVDDSLIIENLVFEGKTNRLGTASEAVLLELIDALAADDDLVVELLIHTDARKSERYNWLLAERRGILLKEYLDKKGIDPQRYRILPVGEQKIFNHCTNGKRCSVADHRINNRVELIRHPDGKVFPVEK